MTERSQPALPVGLDDAPAGLRLLFAHWNEIRGDALMPPRGRLDPGRMVPVLPWLQITEYRSRRHLHCRLAGTGLRDLFGFDYTGHNIIDLSPPLFQRVRAYRLASMIGQPCGSLYGGAVPFQSGAEAETMGLALPLQPDRADGFPMLVSALVVTTEPKWVNAAWTDRDRDRPIGMASHFRFLDIGAGVPSGIEPPEDWDMAGD